MIDYESEFVTRGEFNKLLERFDSIDRQLETIVELMARSMISRGDSSSNTEGKHALVAHVLRARDM